MQECKNAIWEWAVGGVRRGHNRAQARFKETMPIVEFWVLLTISQKWVTHWLTFYELPRARDSARKKFSLLIYWRKKSLTSSVVLRASKLIFFYFWVNYPCKSDKNVFVLFFKQCFRSLLFSSHKHLLFLPSSVVCCYFTTSVSFFWLGQISFVT